MSDAKTGQLTPEEWASLSKATQTKIKIVNSQRSAQLIEWLSKFEDDYQKALYDQTEHKNANATFLCSIGSDCQAVKEFLAGLNPPETDAGKKTTVAEREAWLTKQRKENKELFVLIERQKTAAFILESDKNQIAIIENKMSNVRAVLALRTAQLSFLSGG
jgi:hypothetical protein